MRVFLFIVALYVALPLFGLYNFEPRFFLTYSINPNTFDGIHDAYQTYLLAGLISFALASALFLILIPRRGKTVRFDPAAARNTGRLITMFMLAAAAIAFMLGGREILAGSLHRGELRTSFGGVGFLYKTLIVYLVPAALAYSGALYKLAIDGGRPIGFPFLHLALCVVTTAMMGYKAAILVGLIPFFMIVVSTMKLRTQILAGVVALSMLLFYSFFVVIDTQGDLLDVGRYLVLRATQGTAWGLAASWDVAATPNPDAYRVLLPVFGPRMTASLMGIEFGTFEQLQFSAGRYVSYLVHPNPELVLAGETNLTITLAGEAIYLLGRDLFWVAGIPAGILVALLSTLFLRKNQQNAIISQVVIAVFAINVFLPILNSGGIVGLYSAYTVFYIFITAGFLFMISFMGKILDYRRLPLRSDPAARSV